MPRSPLPHFWLLLGALLLWTPSIQAKTPDIQSRVATLKTRAERGDAKAQNDLGGLYIRGAGVEKSYEQAAVWIRKAAHQGDAAAQVNLGHLFRHGLGVPQSIKESIKWYGKAADGGDAEAQFLLGGLYAKGDEAPQDHSAAFHWYSKAAKQGHANAQVNLGKLYQHGQGVKQNRRQALRWYVKAAKQGQPIAQYNLGIMYATGNSVSINPDKAIMWFEKAARQGDADAQNNLGYLYETGRAGVKKDLEKALYWYREAADRGQTNALAALKKQYETQAPETLTQTQAQAVTVVTPGHEPLGFSAALANAPMAVTLPPRIEPMTPPLPASVDATDMTLVKHLNPAPNAIRKSPAKPNRATLTKPHQLRKKQLKRRPIRHSRSDPKVARVQRRLWQRGFNPGPIDGRLGPKTKRAIRLYQRQQRIRVNGRITRQLTQRLFGSKKR
ncbi:MAG: SEL1-like repeat protein [Magnetococcales bacterium]|nr:SEL1-like repeat protein [Magnetococcales bacterium]